MDATDAAADTERPSIPDRKQRKSVVFNSEALVVEPDGKIVTMASEETKDTAISHTPRTPPLSAALGAFTDAKEAPVDDAAPLAEEGGLDLLKKKKKKPKKTEDADGAEADGAADGAADAGGLDLTLKKKKKKKAPKAGEGDEFAAKLAALDLEKEGGDAEGAVDSKAEEQSGDMEKGTGIWSHDETKAISYDLLLSRFFSLLAQKNPDHASSGTRSYKIPPPQCLREGNKKTIFANIQEITKRMKRSEEHVTAYLFAELGTNGSVDGSRRLVIKGRFQQKQIENVLRKYIIEYVTCKTCRSPDTELNKGENRLYFITCNSCGSRRSVTAIKTGFSAQVGKRKKMQG
ncbi:domain found in IF2B/IF5-domain-containing protein [Annulohypoxylon truncatum]|uniref:domain found in IF2B/IF5-domain-containing protein n=1 Tax=Annulohypoxylon truncatum TaxID=327061 RepID=UPI0020077363|nr:domain found in IF2B/IF5-domain-containing protein [Annulohypoxylon truncatum]KAI1204648.1 domain found in IF2B/IF5-domain-containing protein [Annulohypoxylon truncatum]